jgi:hypothetical protein
MLAGIYQERNLEAPDDEPRNAPRPNRLMARLCVLRVNCRLINPPVGGVILAICQRFAFAA